MGGQRWTDTNVLGKRSYFTVTQDPPRLVLEPVHASDQAVYTCRVDYIFSPSTTVTVNLTVISEFLSVEYDNPPCSPFLPSFRISLGVVALESLDARYHSLLPLMKTT